MTKPTIGVLALQGCVAPHQKHIEACGAVYLEVKTAVDFAEVDGFILPGGESTTMLKLIHRFGLWDVLKDEFAKKPVWGICAGAILLATEVQNPTQESFGLLDMTVTRNGYGRQLDSHYGKIDGYTVSFIRAPVIEKVGSTVTVKAESDDKPIWVEDDLYMATTFHPELTEDTPSPMHGRFIEMVALKNKN